MCYNLCMKNGTRLKKWIGRIDWLLIGTLCVLIIGYVMPVSYTHLDVYKRQVFTLAPKAKSNGRFQMSSTAVSTTEMMSCTVKQLPSDFSADS